MEGHALKPTHAHALLGGQEISAKMVKNITLYQVKIPMSPTNFRVALFQWTLAIHDIVPDKMPIFL